MAFTVCLAFAGVACSDDETGSGGGTATIDSEPGVVTSIDDEPQDVTAETPKAEPARTVAGLDAPAGRQPDGFTTATVRVTSADGEVCEVCVWWADTAEERGRGLMEVTDLGEPVGMAFRFDEPLDGRFFMFGTPMPLSIAWFDESGAYVGAADMEPCLTDDSATCARYGPGTAYLTALEMVQGELGVIGVGPGSTLEVLGEHEVCP